MTYIGIDAGGTLVKVAYQDEEKLQFKSFPSRELDKVVEWVNHAFLDARICVTGGKSEVLAEKLPNNPKIIVEFDATSKGVSYLASQSQSELSGSFVLANIGTGTSIHFIEKGMQERLIGTGVGGGTLMGLSSLLTDIRDFDEMVNLAAAGDRQYVDLKVKDIFEGAVPPISGDLTASNFGKIHPAEERKATHPDILASIMGLIGETVVTICSQASEQYKTDSIAYIGSTLRSNPLLKKIMGDYTILRGKQPYFIENGEFSGAVGALLSLNE